MEMFTTVIRSLEHPARYFSDIPTMKIPIIPFYKCV